MSAAIDATYRSQRLRLASTVTAQALRTWDITYRERDRAIATLVPLVLAGQSQTVRLVEAYMLAKARNAGEPVRRRDLPRELYTVGVLRGVPADEVYGRPFGALGAHLERGESFAEAMASARAAVGKLASTDLQLAQTHAARDFMSAEERVVGYRRVLGGGKNCSLCVSASTRTYRKDDLAPIHERCGCSVAPLFGEAPVASVGTTVKVIEDPEIGPRLVADTWTETGPRLLEDAA